MNRPLGLTNASPIKQLERRQSLGYLPRGWIDGLILSNDGSDATNDIAISAGACRSTVNIVDGAATTLTRDQIDLDIPAPIIKQLDVAWAPDNYSLSGFSGGDRSGGRSSSSISNTTWHVFAIGASDRQPDILLHDSVVQASVLAALPGGYTAYRRVASVIRSGGAILAFSQFGDSFLLSTAVRDVNVTDQSSTAVLRALTVPIGIKVEPYIRLTAGHASSAVVVFTSPDESDQAPSSSVSPLMNALTTSSYTFANTTPGLRTNTSGQIRTNSNNSATTLIVATYGWRDNRDRDS